MRFRVKASVKAQSVLTRIEFDGPTTAGVGGKKYRSERPIYTVRTIDAATFHRPTYAVEWRNLRHIILVVSTRIG